MAAKTPNKINGTENATMMERPSQPTPEVTGAAAMAPENTASEIEALQQRIVELEAENETLTVNFATLSEQYQALDKVTAAAQDEAFKLAGNLRAESEALSKLADENERLDSCLSNLLAKVGLDPNGDLLAISEFEPTVSTSETKSLRTTMLLAMLPQVRIEHAHHDAQRADKAVDDIMKAWGLEQ